MLDVAEHLNDAGMFGWSRLG